MRQPLGSRVIEDVRCNAAADENGDPGSRQMGEPGYPQLALFAQAAVGHPVQRRGILQDVRTIRQPVLRCRHDQVEALQTAPRAAEVDQSHAMTIRRCPCLDPARDWLVAAAGGDDEIGPRRLQRARLRGDDPRQRCSQDQVGDDFVSPVGEALDFVRPVQGFCQRQHLSVVASFMAHENPHQRCGDRGVQRRLSVMANGAMRGPISQGHPIANRKHPAAP